MSDEDLVMILEQVHQGRVQLPAAAPSLLNAQQPSSPASAGPPPPGHTSQVTPDTRNTQSASEEQPTASNSMLSPITHAEQQQDDQQTPPNPSRLAEKQAEKEQEAPAAPSLSDAWQQQTYRLQAFATPLMQRLQGTNLEGQAFTYTIQP